jgi:signal transduction histidine kinase
VRRAIETKEYIVAGPFVLVQGGTAIVARMPIFLPLIPATEDPFWGFATVVLDWEPLLRSGGITEAANRMRIAIRGRDALGAEGEVFFGDSTIFAAEPVAAEVALPSGSWQMAAIPLHGWPRQAPGASVVWAGGLALAAIAGWLTHSRFATQQRLNRAERARRAAQEMTDDAERASKAKTRLLASASHDLRQPLQALGLYVALLEREATTPRAADIIDRFKSTVKAMQELVGAVLDVSRLDAGMITPQRTVFPINAVLLEMVREAEPICAAKGLRLRSVCSSVLVESDRALLGAILRNLVQNATKFTDRGSILMGVRRGAGRVRLCVIDTGVGIQPENLRQIFEEFAQVGKRADTGDSGLGLGLSIVERLARVLDHRVIVASTVGKGSCFAVEIPLAPAVIDESAATGRSKVDSGHTG